MKTKELRKRPRSQRQPCCICGKHKQISESHHLVSLACACAYMNVGLENDVKLKINLPEIWLCPNHHSYLHFFRKKQEWYILGNYFFYDAKLSELLAYARILRMTIGWLESAIDNLFRLWNEGEIDERTFRTVYGLVCEDLSDWGRISKYVGAVLKMKGYKENG